MLQVKEHSLWIGIMKCHLSSQVHVAGFILHQAKEKAVTKNSIFIYCYFLIITKLMCHTAANELQTKFLVVFTAGNEICGEGKEEPCQMCLCPTPPL